MFAETINDDEKENKNKKFCFKNVNINESTYSGN